MGISNIYTSNKIIWILKQLDTKFTKNKRNMHPRVTYEHTPSGRKGWLAEETTVRKMEQAGIAFDPVAFDDISYLVSLFVSYLVTMPMCS